MIVEPERDTPGTSAQRLREADQRCRPHRQRLDLALLARRPSRRAPGRCRARSARSPISTSWRASVSILSLNARPRIEIGIVPTIRYQPSRASSVPRASGSRSERSQRARDVPQVVAEVQEDRRHRPELDDGGERGARVVPAEERRDEAQVRGGGDRQELGEPLDDARGRWPGVRPWSAAEASRTTSERRCAVGCFQVVASGRGPESARTGRTRGRRGSAGGRARGSRPSRCVSRPRSRAARTATAVCSRVCVT